MRTIKVKILSVNELSEKALEYAFAKFNADGDYPCESENSDSLEAFCNNFPVKNIEWDYDCSSSYIYSEFMGESDIANLSGKRLLAYLINHYLDDLFEAKKYPMNRRTEKLNYHNRVSMKLNDRKLLTPFYELTYLSAIKKVETCCPFTGYYMDEELLSPIREFI